MTGRSCGVCGAAAGPGARFCADCGAPLDATVVDLTRDDSASRARRPGRTGGRGPAPVEDEAVAADLGAESIASSLPVRRVVALALMAVAATVGAVTLAAGDTAEDATRPRPVPTVDATLRNDAPRPIPTPTPTTRSSGPERPESTPVATPAVIDSRDLPPMGATHLAVIGRETLEFLDLGTGIWTRASSWSAEPVAAHAVRGGVVVQGSGAWAFAGTDGGDVTTLAGDGSGFGLVGDDRLVTAQFDATGGRLEARRFDGSVAWSASLPTGAWPVGLSDGGEVIVQVAERIVALDDATGAPRVVATGSAVTTFDDAVVFWSCDEALRCATRQRDLRSAVESVVSDGQWYFEASGPGRFVGYPQTGGELRSFAVVDGVLTEVDDAVPVDLSRSVVDTTGVLVELGRDTIQLTTSGGDVTTIPAPPGAGPATILRLVTAD